MVTIVIAFLITGAVIIVKLDANSDGSISAAIAERIRSGGRLNRILSNEQIKEALKDPQVLDLINHRIINGK